MFKEIQISEIEVPSDRKLRSDVPVLAKSIEEIGLLHAITVRSGERKGYKLVAGLHRLEAVKSLGKTTIMANVVDLETSKIDLAEIDENLIRSDIAIPDRADRLERRQQILAAFHPKTSKEDNHRSLEHGDKDQSTIQRLLQISRGIPQDLKAQIRNTPLAYNEIELSRLARIEDPKDQRAAALAYISGEHISIFVPQKPGPMTSQQSSEALVELIIEHVPADLWPKIEANLKILAKGGDNKKYAFLAFRKLMKTKLSNHRP